MKVQQYKVRIDEADRDAMRLGQLVYRNDAIFGFVSKFDGVYATFTLFEPSNDTFELLMSGMMEPVEEVDLKAEFCRIKDIVEPDILANLEAILTRQVWWSCDTCHWRSICQMKLSSKCDGAKWRPNPEIVRTGEEE